MNETEALSQYLHAYLDLLSMIRLYVHGLAHDDVHAYRGRRCRRSRDMGPLSSPWIYSVHSRLCLTQWISDSGG